jgi:hypothetical protein
LQLAAAIVALDCARAAVVIVKSSDNRSEIERMRFIMDQLLYCQRNTSVTPPQEAM